MKKLMKKLHIRPVCAVLACAGLLGLVSCVDNDYDLTGDIDKLVNVGGTLQVPGSSTEKLTLGQLINLKEGGSIKADAEGNYSLVQSGSGTSANFDVPAVEIGASDAVTASTMLTFALPKFDIPPGVDIPEMELDPILTETGLIENTVTLEGNNITEVLTSLKSAKMDVSFDLDVNFTSDEYDGTAYVKAGYKFILPSNWTISIDPSPYLTVEGSTIKFVKDCPISEKLPFHIRVKISAMDFSKLPAGQGLTHPNGLGKPGKFILKGNISSDGQLELRLKTSDFPNIREIKDIKLNLQTKAQISKAVIKEATCVVEPKIDVKSVVFNIKDVPDFLTEDGNSLDIYNPQITLKVSNSSPLSIKFSAKAVSYDANGKQLNVVDIPAAGAPAIVIPGNTTPEVPSRFVLCREAGKEAGVTYVVVPNLSKIVETIPSKIEFTNIKCEPVAKEETYKLGTAYSFSADYEAEIPLKFGDNTRFSYSTKVDGWNQDLKDYDFHTIQLSLDVVNDLPLSVKPTITPIFLDGSMPSVEVSQDIATIQGDGTTTVKILVKSLDRKLKGLDGIDVKIEGSIASKDAGKCINENMGVKLENITVKIIGGIDIDANNL